MVERILWFHQPTMLIIHGLCEVVLVGGRVGMSRSKSSRSRPRSGETMVVVVEVAVASLLLLLLQLPILRYGDDNQVLTI